MVACSLRFILLDKPSRLQDVFFYRGKVPSALFAKRSRRVHRAMWTTSGVWLGVRVVVVLGQGHRRKGEGGAR